MNASRCTLLLTTFACLWGYQIHTMEEKDAGKSAQLVVAAAAKQMLSKTDKAEVKIAGNKKKKTSKRTRKRKKKQLTKTYAQAVATTKEIKDKDTKAPAIVTKDKEKAKVAEPKNKKVLVQDNDGISLDVIETPQPQKTKLDHANQPYDTYPHYCNWGIVENKPLQTTWEETGEKIYYSILLNESGKPLHDEKGRIVEDKEKSTTIKLYKRTVPQSGAYKYIECSNGKTDFDDYRTILTEEPSQYLQWKKVKTIIKKGWMSKDELNTLSKKYGGRVKSKLNKKTNDIDYYLCSWVATEIENEKKCHFVTPYGTVKDQYGKVTKNREDVNAAKNLVAVRTTYNQKLAALKLAQQEYFAADQELLEKTYGLLVKQQKSNVLLQLFETRICPTVIEKQRKIREQMLKKAELEAAAIKTKIQQRANVLSTEKELLESKQQENNDSLADINAVLPKEENKTGWWS